MLNSKIVMMHVNKISQKLKIIYNYTESEEIKNLILKCNEIIKVDIGLKTKYKRISNLDSEVLREKCDELFDLISQIENINQDNAKIEKYVNVINRYLECIKIEC